MSSQEAAEAAEAAKKAAAAEQAVSDAWAQGDAASVAVLEAEAKKLSEEAEREKREAEEAGQELEVAEQAEELAVPEALVTPATSEIEMTEEERARSIAIFHAMDEDGGGTVGDQFMANIEQVAGNVPYMVSVGT